MKILSERVIVTTNDANWLLDKGEGDREYRSRITFTSSFDQKPVVQVSLAHLDIFNGTNSRIGVVAFNVDLDGFDLVFQTWADTQIAGIGVVWLAYGD